MDADAHRVRKLGLVLTNRDGRYLEVHEIKEGSIIAECNDSVEGWIAVGDKILGLNNVPGEARVASQKIGIYHRASEPTHSSV